MVFLKANDPSCLSIEINRLSYNVVFIYTCRHCNTYRLCTNIEIWIGFGMIYTSLRFGCLSLLSPCSKQSLNLRTQTKRGCNMKVGVHLCRSRGRMWALGCSSMHSYSRYWMVVCSFLQASFTLPSR
jgi:hypothetical protein